ncbi:MAG: phenylalanine--tRNA ligase subunit beta [Syntrophomonadaceae bacterium]|nr:phenylalanine--tRNA ligase subunit beta [Syntrophomonadaceae bacterium]
MGVSVNWLKEYVSFDWSPEELAHRLTMAGIAIEGVEHVEGDSLLELDLTPNRGDCLGMINLAREIAALNHSDIAIPVIELVEGQNRTEDEIKIEIKAPDLCPRYTARVIRNVKVGDSPAWIQSRLMGAGIRPINNIVDITNYVMLECNQPLHAFDYDLLGPAKKIVVRRANQGECITTLDDVARELDRDMLLITDDGRPVALAGIMGGQNTQINEKTVNVLLESACFKGTGIRRTARKLALRSDSSVRFEKGIDINGVIYASNRAAALMAKYGGGEVSAGICDCYPDPQPLSKISLRPERVNYLLGTELSPAQIQNYLNDLKLEWQIENGALLVTIPSYRPDIEMEADLIEEVARLHGYENIPATLPCGDTTQGGLDPFQKFKDQVKQLMANQFYEIITYSFVSPRYFDMLMLPPDSKFRQVVRVANPLSEEQSIMRPLLLPGMLETVSRNLARKNTNLAFFEMGSVFHPLGEELPLGVLKLGAIVAGSTDPNWLKLNLNLDYYYLKGSLENLFSKLGVEDVGWEETQEPSFHPGRTARIVSQGIQLGIIGEIHPLVRQQFDIRPRTCAFELDMENLYACSRPKVMMSAITRYPAVERDLAMVAKQEVQAARAVDIIKEFGGDLLAKVQVFDIYTGEQVAPGHKSMAFNLTFQSDQRTLTESEVNERMELIREGLRTRLQANFR